MCGESWQGKALPNGFCTPDGPEEPLSAGSKREAKLKGREGLFLGGKNPSDALQLKYIKN